MTTDFNSLTKKYIDETDLAHRKAFGQYFTPRPLREHLLSALPKAAGASILDPACGTGEFLLSAKEYFPKCRLHGWEIDRKLVKMTRKIVPSADIRQTDSLREDPEPQFDFVIGNPPYFELKPDSELKERYHDVISGRANIFAMFVKLGLRLVRPNGYVAYVIPPSMNNGAYFTALRRFIIKHAKIEYLAIEESASLFDKAQQAVMILVLKKCANRGDYVFEKNGISVFSTDTATLKRAFRGKTTLKELRMSVRTGRIVWNQHRDKLTTRHKNAIPLIRAHNITKDGLVLENSSDRPQYIRFDGYDSGPAIVVNRVTGTATKVSLKAALIEPGFHFLGENHVNVIFPPPGLGQKKAVSILQRVVDQINSPATSDTMRLVTGNTQISRTELECLLPLNL